MWADPYSWTGNASTDWAVGANWDGSVVPLPTDSVTIPAGRTNYPSLRGDTTVKEVTIESGASLNTNTYNLTLSGTLTNNGAFVMNGGTVKAGSVSGSGTFSLSGSIITPAKAQNYGGKVTVTGITTINTTGANAVVLTPAQNGGSVTFSDTVSINKGLSIITVGGNGVFASGGDGGSVTFDNTVSLNETLSIETKGGSKGTVGTNGTNGDVSFKNTVNGSGSLIVQSVKDITVTGAIGNTTPLNLVTLEAVTGNITIASSVTLSGNWNNNSGKTAVLPSIEFTGTSSSAITGTNTFTTFRCTTAGKTISFPEMVTTTIGSFSVEGALTSYITMQGASGAPWNLNFTGSTGNRTTPNLKYVSIKTGNLAAGNSIFVFADRTKSSSFTPVSGTRSWMFGMETLRKWTGTASTVWTDGANWDGNVVPDPGDDVEIPTVTNQPVIPSGGVSTTDAIISGDVNGSDTFTIMGNLNITGETTISSPLAVTGETIIDSPSIVSLTKETNTFADAITVTNVAKLTLKASNSVTFAALNARDSVILDVSAGTVTQTALINTSQLSLSGNAAYTLTHANNSVSTLAAGAGTGEIQFTHTDTGIFTVDTIRTINGITRTGNVSLYTGTSKLVINQPITAQSFTQSGTGEATLAANVTTTANQRYTGPVKLGANVTLSTTSNGNITFFNTLNSDSAAHTLTLAAAGTGKITFNGATGTAISLPTLAITAASTVNFNADVKADDLAFSGAGTTTNLVFNGVANNQTISIDVPQSSFSNVTGTVTIGNHVDDSTTFTSGFTQTATGGEVTLAGTIKTTTATAPIEFTNNVTFTGNTNLETINSNIVFGGTLQSASSGSILKATVGTGNIEFKGIVGTGGVPNAFGLDIVSAHNVTTSNALFVKGLRQQAGSGKTTLTGKITTTDDIVSIITHDIEIRDGIVMGSPALCTLINSGLLQIKGEINNAGTFAQIDGNTLTATDHVELGANITTTNNTVSFASPVTLTANAFVSTGTGIGDITFNSAINSTTTMQNLTLTAGTGSIVFKGAIGTTRSLNELNILSAAPTPANSAGIGIQFAASVRVQILSITPANSPETAPNVYISGNATFTIGTPGTPPAEIDFPANLFIAVQGSGTVRFSGTVKTGGSLVLFSGELLPVADIIVQKDLVLLNGQIPSMFAGNGFAGLFGYNAQNMDAYAAARGTRTAAAKVVFPSALPDGTVLDHTTGRYSGSFAANALSGKTLSVAGNFYANGVHLNPSGNWTLKLADNASAASAFAESYNLTAAYCTVESLIAGGFSWITAAENCIDGNNNTTTVNTGWAFRRPEILANNPVKATGTELSGTYTVYDDVIRVEFSYNTTPHKTSAKIENSNNEISAALAVTQFNNKAAPFAGAFIDPDCVTSTDGQGDLSVFYLRTGTDASNGLRWNTDATGSNAGNTQSTDRGRINSQPQHQNILPDISIPSALAGLYQTLRDNYKNRIASVSNFDTADRCRPVLIETLTGQELHTVSTHVQEPYDSHNFIELRYSEAVHTGGLAETEKNVKSSLSFTTATEWGGAITEHTGGGFAITGYIQTQTGTLKTGSRTALNPPTIKQNDPEVHALYRFFPQNLSEVAQAQTHRLRISIAGFSSGTVSGPDNISVPFWGGYIDSSVIPRGSVTVMANSHITDRSAALADGNILEPTENNNSAYGQTGAASYPKHSVSINSAEQTNTVYGEWDTSPPVFASYNSDILGWGTGIDHEILGIDSTNTGYIDAMEFHFFDSTPQKAPTDPFYGSNYWVSKFGWTPIAGNGFLPPSNTSFAAQDIIGGARAFSSDTAARTAGGVRSSSLYGSLRAFSYGLNTDGTVSLFSSFEQVLFSQKVETQGFFGTYNKRSTDNLYLKLSLLSADRMQYNPRQTFSIQYDTATGFITDLAGNRMKKAEVLTVDRTPPKFSMTILPVEGQELFILFNKPLQIAPANLSKIPSQFEIFDKTDSSVKNNIINTSVAAKVRYNTLDTTALILTLNQSNPDGPITFEKILKYGLRTIEGELEPDPLTGQLVRQPQIFDLKGNAMISRATHQLSDFGVFAAIPLFALSNPVVTNGVTGPDFEALRNFNGGGKLFSETPSTFEIRLALPSLSGSPSNLGALTMFAGTNPSTGSVSETFNKNTGASLKIWLPEAMPVISSIPNTNHKTISEDSPLNNNLRKFLLLKAADFDWKSGDTIEFLFKYKNPNYIPDPSKEPYEEPMPSIYCLRLANPSDIASLDLWRFDLFDLTRQRGGTTILNNVINANTREETVLEVAMPKAGNLNISVMTIDGNIVKVLHRGRAEAGTSYYRWDGTNNGGRTVSRGMYFIRISGTDIDETRKVMVVYD